MKKLNIWLIQTGEQLPVDKNIRKMRTAILADKLIENGHSVLWWTSAFDHLKKIWVFKRDCEIELKEGLRIKVLKGIGYKENISILRFIDYKIVARKFKYFAPKIVKPDIIIASTPSYDLAYEAVTFAKRNNIPVLVDIRDEWPDLFIRHIPSVFRHLIKLILFNEFRMIRKTMLMADGLISMMKSFLEWGLKYAEREKTWRDRIFYLGCAKESKAANCSAEILELIDNLNDKFVVTFIGSFSLHNDPSDIVDCASKLVDREIRFVLAGDGKLFNDIKQRASKLSNIVLTGWLNIAEINALLKSSAVGVCPTSQVREAFPNKAFVYFSAGLPVVTAFNGDIRETLDKYQIGFYYPPGDIDALVRRIKTLYSDSDLYEKMSENAIKVFSKFFDAEVIYEEYAGHIERIVSDYCVKS